MTFDQLLDMKMSQVVRQEISTSSIKSARVMKETPKDQSELAILDQFEECKNAITQEFNAGAEKAGRKPFLKKGQGSNVINNPKVAVLPNWD